MQAIPQTLVSEHASTSQQASAPAAISGDARLRRGLIETDVSRRCALTVTLVFLAVIYGIPLTQATLELHAGDESSLAGLFQRLPTEENLRSFEQEIEQASYLKELVQPQMQLLLSRWGRTGNRRTILGRDGWLFYAPGLTHTAGPSFIDPDALARRALEDEPATADPRPAITAFGRMLAARGIALVLFPVPDKAMLQPRELHARARGAAALPVANNLGFEDFVDELRAQGIHVFQPAPAQLHTADAPRYLVQDTHWTPQWMDQVARQLARTLVELDTQLKRSPTAWHVVPQQAERVGDLVDALKLPDDQALFQAQTVTIEQVRADNGELWQPNPQAEILLLGDSFTNVFSESMMGWGEAAGFAPHLSLALGRDLDVISQNDAGAFATRQALARALAAGDDRLAGKRIVVWELAARELSVGDWKHIDWPEKKEVD